MPPLTLPPKPDAPPYTAVFYGVILLIWLTSESKNILLTTLLGTGLAILITHLALIHRFGGQTLSFRRYFPLALGLGAWLGLFASLTTSLLMVIKNVQHSHLYPDFSGEVVLGIWQRIPAWSLAGLLIAAALTLAYTAIPQNANM